MSKYHIPLLPGNYYHLFSRAVGNEKLFLSEENYNYFLVKLKSHIVPVADLFAYSLLPNHFHLLARIKEDNELAAYFELKKEKPFDAKIHSLPDFTMEQFSNCLNGYAKAFNNMYNRKGGLFIDYLKRSEAKVDNDITSFLFYIHKNAIHHGLAKKMGEWSHDSYNTIISKRPTTIKREEVIGWFGSVKQFIEFHDRHVELKQVNIFDL
ncbi:MAG TPA: hypothetical protein VF476_17905 [Chitinophagaceae bacterium]